MRFLKRVNDRGTVTLPHEVRQVLGIEEGDIVEFEVVRVVKPGSVELHQRAARTEPNDMPHASLEA